VPPPPHFSNKTLLILVSFSSVFLLMCIMRLVLVIAWVAVKFGINTMSVVLEMGINFMSQSQVKFAISITTRVVFIQNFTANCAIPS